MATINADVLIIGCGIAGGITALRLADAGVPVVIATRSQDPAESNTFWSQGGIIFEGQEDTPERLAKDILAAGAGLSNPDAVKVLAENGPRLLEDVLINRLGIEFDVEGRTLSLAREGGHSLARIVHVADATGKAIEVKLIQALKEHPNVTLLTQQTGIDLITSSHHSVDRLQVYAPLTCVGAYFHDRRTREVTKVMARATVLATGGLGQIYAHNTNPLGARGDGQAMAYRAGARVINMEFVQFHPTTFVGANGARFLITEAVRGDGGRLVHADNTPFMDKYDAVWKDLAPRDVVARAIYQEMLEHDVPYVYLNLRDYIPEERIRHHFPTILQRCADAGVDITNELVPVVPGAHYACGGVWVDDWGKSTLAGLYAVGEVACTGLHGANRLASTSLLEGLVWGDRAAQHIKANLHLLHQPNSSNYPDWEYADGGAPDPALIGQDYGQIKALMWNYVGLVRTTQRLERALRELRRFEQEIEFFYRTTHLTDGLIGLRNAARTATLVAQAAWTNRTSVGCHFRE